MKPITTTLKDIANQALNHHSEKISFSEFINQESASNTSEIPKEKIPNYVFLTPPSYWGQRFSESIPIPRPLVIFDKQRAKGGEELQSDYNLTEIATNTQKHGNFQTYSFELQFYLGSAGTGAPVHYHGHAINTLAYGEKVFSFHLYLFFLFANFYSSYRNGFCTLFPERFIPQCLLLNSLGKFMAI